MTNDDMTWMEKLLSQKAVQEPVLELGVGYGGGTCRELIVGAKLTYVGTDLEPTPAVDVVANFERAEDMAAFGSRGPFGSVLILNVLEHTFEPLRILDNAMSLLRPGGTCIVLTPSIWPLHEYPIDSLRLLPNFYEEYARRRGVTLDRRFFDYVAQGPVASFRGPDGTYSYPPPCRGPFRWFYSRAIHKLFRTCGRAMFHPSHVAIGVVFQKPMT